MRRQRMPHKKPPGIDIGSLFVGDSLVVDSGLICLEVSILLAR